MHKHFVLYMEKDVLLWWTMCHSCINFFDLYFLSFSYGTENYNTITHNNLWSTYLFNQQCITVVWNLDFFV